MSHPRLICLRLPLKVPQPDGSGSAIGMRIGRAVRRWEASTLPRAAATALRHHVRPMVHNGTSEGF